MGAGHACVVIGAKHDGKNGFLVFLVDPNQRSDPKIPHFLSIYAMPYGDFIANLMTIGSGYLWRNGKRAVFSSSESYALYNSSYFLDRPNEDGIWQRHEHPFRNFVYKILNPEPTLLE